MIPNVIPVSATRWGRQSRLARTMSSIASRSAREQKRPVYRYSSTALIQLRVVLGNSTLGAENIQNLTWFRSWRIQQVCTERGRARRNLLYNILHDQTTKNIYFLCSKRGTHREFHRWSKYSFTELSDTLWIIWKDTISIPNDLKSFSSTKRFMNL